jgi:hypothetical protein
MSGRLALVASLLSLVATACERSGEAVPLGLVATGEGSGASTSDETPTEATLPILDYGPGAPTLFLTSGLKGYVEPCGCTAGLHVGGLDRLVGFVEAAREEHAPDAAVVDTGNLLFEHREIEPHLVEQERAKAAILVAAHRQLGTISTTPGPTDLALGVAFYTNLLAEAELPIVVANLAATDGTAIGTPSLVHRIGELDVGIVGAVDPAVFEGIGDVSATAALPAVTAAVEELRGNGVETILLVFQGDVSALRTLTTEVEGIDFAIVGVDPAETDAVEESGGTQILNVYDQGRYVGILKLYAGPTGEYGDARHEDRETVDRIARRLQYLRSQLALLPPSLQGEEPAIVLTMRSQIEQLEAEREVARNADLRIPEAGGVFLFWPVALVPGYPVDPEVRTLIDGFFLSLRELNAGRNEIVPLGDGDVGFAGIEVCRWCHEPAYEVWSQTPHANAMETLERLNRDFDEVCVSCHVTGYRLPGGAVIGDHNGLANVQCESCHGPGQAHADEPPERITSTTVAAVCTGCHNPDHSPEFGYDRYLPLTLGPGHGD